MSLFLNNLQENTLFSSFFLAWRAAVFFFIISLKSDFFKGFGLSVEQQCLYSFEKQHGFNILVSKMWKRKHSYSISLKSYNVLFHLTHNQIPKGILYTIQKSRKSFQEDCSWLLLVQELYLTGLKMTKQQKRKMTQGPHLPWAVRHHSNAFI